MPKLYKAVDRVNSHLLCFLELDNGNILTTKYIGDDDFEIRFARQVGCDGNQGDGDPPSRLKDAIAPVLIAEW